MESFSVFICCTVRINTEGWVGGGLKRGEAYWRGQAEKVVGGRRDKKERTGEGGRRGR